MTTFVSPVTARESPGYDVEALRKEEFPWSRETIYLDHASIGPFPNGPAARSKSSPRSAPSLTCSSTMTCSAPSRGHGSSAPGSSMRRWMRSGWPPTRRFGLSVAARGLPFPFRRYRPGERPGVPRQRVSVAWRCETWT